MTAGDRLFPGTALAQVHKLKRKFEALEAAAHAARFELDELVTLFEQTETDFDNNCVAPTALSETVIGNHASWAGTAVPHTHDAGGFEAKLAALDLSFADTADVGPADDDQTETALHDSDGEQDGDEGISDADTPLAATSFETDADTFRPAGAEAISTGADEELQDILDMSGEFDDDNDADDLTETLKAVSQEDDPADIWSETEADASASIDDDAEFSGISAANKSEETAEDAGIEIEAEADIEAEIEIEAEPDTDADAEITVEAEVEAGDDHSSDEADLSDHEMATALSDDQDGIMMLAETEADSDLFEAPAEIEAAEATMADDGEIDLIAEADGDEELTSDSDGEVELVAASSDAELSEDGEGVTEEVAEGDVATAPTLRLADDLDEAAVALLSDTASMHQPIEPFDALADNDDEAQLAGILADDENVEDTSAIDLSTVTAAEAEVDDAAEETSEDAAEDLVAEEDPVIEDGAEETEAATDDTAGDLVAEAEADDATAGSEDTTDLTADSTSDAADDQSEATTGEDTDKDGDAISDKGANSDKGGDNVIDFATAGKSSDAPASAKPGIPSAAPRKRGVKTAAILGLGAVAAAVAVALQLPVIDVWHHHMPPMDEILHRLSDLKRFLA